MSVRSDYIKLTKDEATLKSKGDFRCCDSKGCKKEGLYRAPKDRELRNYHWFCLDCVRKYNKDWNFFKDLSFEEIEKEQKEDIYGAKTRKFGVKNKGEFFNKLDDSLNMFGRFKSSMESDESEKEILPLLSKKEKRAIKLFGLKIGFSDVELKKSYKKLVKNHHPDKHGGDKSKENDFKKIVEYRDVLKKLIK